MNTTSAQPPFADFRATLRGERVAAIRKDARSERRFAFVWVGLAIFNLAIGVMNVATGNLAGLVSVGFSLIPVTVAVLKFRAASRMVRNAESLEAGTE